MSAPPPEAIPDFAQAARQFLRAIRGHRSQVAFARRLGYRGNPVADWEAGRRSPTAGEALRACARVGLDVPGAFARFHPGTAGIAAEGSDAGLARWLDALRGGAPVGGVADRIGRSRYAVGRILSGRTCAKLPDFLALLEALTGRCGDFVAGLVPPGSVPELEARYRAREASRDLAFEEPWTEAILRVMETAEYRDLPEHAPGWIAARLGIPSEVEARCLERLLRAASVRREGGRLAAGAPLTVDTRGDPGRVWALKRHWAAVGRDRCETPREGDLVSYNVFSVSLQDLERIRELHRAYFREIRQIVASSRPEEVAALVVVQLLPFTG